MMSFGVHERRPWALDEAAAEPIVRRAVQGGITFFDTADSYAAGASEVITGRLVGKLLTREEAVVATKVNGPTMPGENGRGLSRKHILASIDASLTRLGMDYVDLYQIHRWDYATPIEETVAALHDVVRSGKARYIGASSMFAWQFAKAQTAAALHRWTRFDSMQNHNLVYREEEREMIPMCVDQGVGVIPWSPLARGMLAGNRTASGERLTQRANTDANTDSLYTPEVDFAVVERVAEVARTRSVSSAQVALAWLLHKPGVTAPIVGATKVAHVEDALAAVELGLDESEIASLEEPYCRTGPTYPAAPWRGRSRRQRSELGVSPPGLPRRCPRASTRPRRSPARASQPVASPPGGRTRTRAGRSASGRPPAHRRAGS
jgi:aryl-alcohol dehydrogenase-like predicted oxidoreductase